MISNVIECETLLLYLRDGYLINKNAKVFLQLILTAEDIL